ncbi:MAG: formylglycine-generating enzyme family protein [Pseudomonadota bacterium]
MRWRVAKNSIVASTMMALAVGWHAALAEPLETFRDCDVCPEMVALPLGDFAMGSKPNEVRRRWFPSDPRLIYRIDDPWFSDLNELPRHAVTVDVPIALGVNEVTYDQWMACVGGGGCNGYVPPDTVHTQNTVHQVGGNHPVLSVSLLDALAYVDWLNAKLGSESYRLPTEAEWEYAARAGTDTRFAQGDEVTFDQVNFSGIMTAIMLDLDADLWGSRMRPVPVDEMDAANPWGLRHMSGNAHELTSSCYTADGYDEWATTSRWLEEAKGPLCDGVSIRGGSALNGMNETRVARRVGGPPKFRGVFGGFRVAKQLRP